MPPPPGDPVPLTVIEAAIVKAVADAHVRQLQRDATRSSVREPAGPDRQ